VTGFESCKRGTPEGVAIAGATTEATHGCADLRRVRKATETSSAPQSDLDGEKGVVIDRMKGAKFVFCSSIAPRSVRLVINLKTAILEACPK
jgi:hypothetical protein